MCGRRGQSTWLRAQGIKGLRNRQQGRQCDFRGSHRVADSNVYLHPHDSSAQIGAQINAESYVFLVRPNGVPLDGIQIAGDAIILHMVARISRKVRLSPGSELSPHPRRSASLVTRCVIPPPHAVSSMDPFRMNRSRCFDSQSR